MERLLKPAEVGAILGYRDMNRVREIMRSMVHMESPLRVTEKALEKWMNQRMYEGCAVQPSAVSRDSSTPRGCRPFSADKEPLALCPGATNPRMTPDRIPRKKGGRSA